MAKLKPGDKIGPFPYQIVKQLGKGQGNMADVYLATEGDRPDAPLVVLKISRANSDHSDFFTDTIYNESERLRQLSHPGIVRLLPIKTNSASMRAVPYVANASLPGRPWFLVLEHLNGGALDDILTKEKRLPQLLALRIAQRLAATLDYIHRCGQVHLDIKPENILFRRALEPDTLPDPVLIDFGIARNVGQEGLEARTLHYSPPERVLLHKSSLPLEALAKPAPSMDVYSLGVVLYQMLAGRRPFEGQNDKRISSAILNNDPTKPSVYAGSLDPEVEDLVLQALAKDPAARPSAGELAQRLEAIAVRKAYSEPAPNTAATPDKRKAAPKRPPGGGEKRRNRTGLLLAGSVTLAGLALVGALFAGGGLLPGLAPAAGSAGDGEAAVAGVSLSGLWEQLARWLPGAGGAGNDGTGAIAWVTATASAEAAAFAAPAATSTPVPPRPTATSTQPPTSTPAVRNTATPEPTATSSATPAAVALLAPGAGENGVSATSTPLLTATPTTAPTAAPTATASPTSVPPTSTPIGRATAAATAAAAPAVKATATPVSIKGAPAGSAGSTATGGRQSTPVPERKPTPTPVPPTATAGAATTAAATVAATPTVKPAPATAAPSDLSQATVRLLEPADGYTGRGAVTFRWETPYQLAENQAFEPVFWRAGGDPIRDGRGYGGSTRGTSITINWDGLDVAADGYQWGVLLVETNPYKRLHFMGGGFGFQYTGPG